MYAPVVPSKTIPDSRPKLQRARSRSTRYLQITQLISQWQFGAVRRLFSNLQFFAWRRVEMVRLFHSQHLILLQPGQYLPLQNSTKDKRQSQLCFVIFCPLDCFSSWEFRRLIPFYPCYSHTTSGRPVLLVVGHALNARKSHNSS